MRRLATAERSGHRGRLRSSDHVSSVHAGAGPGDSEIVSPRRLVATFDGLDVERRGRLVRDTERPLGRAVIDPDVHGRTDRIRRRAHRWTHSETSRVRCRLEAGRSSGANRFGALITISVPSSGRVRSIRRDQRQRSRSRGPRTRTDDIPRSGRPGLEAVLHDGPGEKAPRRQLTIASATIAAPTTRAAARSSGESQIHSPKATTPNRKTPPIATRDGRPTEWPDHPSRESVASVTGSEQQEHREDAAEQRQGQRPDEIERPVNEPSPATAGPRRRGR